MSNRDSMTDSRNFRMLYYEQLGLRNVDQMKALEHLLSEDPLNQDKIKAFTQHFSLPAVLRPFVWKVLSDIAPLHKESNDFIMKHRIGQYEDLRQALIAMQMITSSEECNHKTIVMLYLLEHGMLSVLHQNHQKKDCYKVYILESISHTVCEIIDNECDAYWITKRMLQRQDQFFALFAKLPKFVKYYLQLEDKRLFEHLYEIQLYKVLPYDKWFQTYFTSVFSESLEYMERIWDKLVAGSCHILVFVCVAIFLTFSIKLKELKSSETALKLISNISENAAQVTIDKTMELWDQYRKSLSVELGCY